MTTTWQRQRHLWLALSVLMILAPLLHVNVPPASVDAQANTVSVNFASMLGAPTYRASGFIYGLSENGTAPAQTLQSDIKVKFIRAGGAQLVGL